MRLPALVLAVVLVPTAAVADGYTAAELVSFNTPPDLLARGEKAKLWADHTIDAAKNPFYLRGDFDGDGRGDYAVAVKRTSDDADRVVVLFAKKKAAWLPDDDTPANDVWYVHDRRTKVEIGVTGDRPPKLRGDAIFIAKAESSSVVLYWTGKTFKTYWQGD
jgi:hypothetical protein